MVTRDSKHKDYQKVRAESDSGGYCGVQTDGAASISLETRLHAHLQRQRLVFLWLTLSIPLLAGCFLLPEPTSPATPHSIAIPSITPASTDAPPLESDLPGGMQDMLPVMSGICYEAAYDARDQVFVLRSAEEHIRFYDLADNSGLCRRPVTRNPFDFTQGAILAGLWSDGIGCTAHHEIVAYDRDDENQTLRILLRFSTEGDCNYELVRPFWVGIPDAQEYEVQIEVVSE